MSEEKTSTGPALIKKLSVSKVYGKVRLNEDEKERDIMQVVGVASGTRTGTSDNGEWVSLIGNFAAVNCHTGEQFRSGQCFMPDVALIPIQGQLDAGAQAVEFGFIITAKADDDAATGYIYTATPMFPPDENDPLEMLVKKLPSVKAIGDDSKGKKK